MLLAAGFVAIVIAVSSVTYLFVERPMQNVGRRVGHWLDARFGPDRVPADASPQPPGQRPGGPEQSAPCE